MHEQVATRCPPGTAVPSKEWLRLQFWPKNPRKKSSLQYTGRLNVKYMIQQRQFRNDHEDSHYTAALFRYQREYAIRLRDYCELVCVDDKHIVKIGEPGCPVAAAEQGRQVIVSKGTTFEVSDHDFTKFSIIPSVALIVNIPEVIADSWYRGQVSISLKDAAFEPSSAIRHSAELVKILQGKPVLFLYSDGGPDHRVTYLSVQVALIALFRCLDLDYLCAVCTAPCQSWHNPVERVMSTVNLGMQCVGLMRKKGTDNYEREASKCNSLSDLRKAAIKSDSFRQESLDSVEPVKLLLSDLFQRLQLKGEKFKLHSSALEAGIDDLWGFITEIEPLFQSSDKLQKASLISKPRLAEFIDHCCRRRHYYFEILKCGEESCVLCRPVCTSTW